MKTSLVAVELLQRIKKIATDDKRLNGEITAREVRLTGADGEQLGIVPLAQAMALAEEASSRGAKVTLILGPSALSTTDTRVDIQRVGTAQEMFEAAKAAYGSADVAILAAAVADYRPATVAEHKIKKNADTYAIELVKTPDIAAELGKLKTKDQINIGFALQTQDGPTNSEAKLEKKNFDFIVLNSLQDPGAGFQHDTNKITILHAKSTPSKGNKIKKFELKSKVAVAKDIVDELEAVLTGKE